MIKVKLSSSLNFLGRNKFSINKVFICFLVLFLSLELLGNVFASHYYPGSHVWGFQDKCYLSFNQSMNFADIPYRGVSYENSIVSYWNLDEGQGEVVYDKIRNASKGLVSGANWVIGNYGNALNFNGVDSFITMPDSSAINFTTNSFTLSTWIKTNTTSPGIIIAKWFPGYTMELRYKSGNLFPYCELYDSTGHGIIGTTAVNDGLFHNIVFVRDRETFNLKLYVDGHLESEVDDTSDDISSVANFTVGYRKFGAYYSGIIDEIRIYDRALSAMEITLLSKNPDPLFFEDYYTFRDSITGKTVMINVKSQSASGENTHVICTSFTNDLLSFESNNTAVVTVITDLGYPVFTTGNWDSEKYMTTLFLKPYFNERIAWASFNITTYDDPHSSIFPSNVTIPCGESQTFNFSSNSNYYFDVEIDGVSHGHISAYTFENVASSHTIIITSKPIFTVEMLLIIVSIIIIFLVLIISLKKGYIIIEINREKDVVNSDLFLDTP